MNDNESVKVHCQIIECRYNLWNPKKIYNCNLKNIAIGIRTINDYPHGVEGMCQNMEK